MLNKVVSRNFLIDFITSIQNFFGMDLTYYERMITKANLKLEDEILKRGWVVKNRRYQVTEMKNGAVIMVLYGEVD